MIDGFLKFTNKAQAESVFEQIGVYPVDGSLTQTAYLEDGTIMSVDVLFGTGIVRSPTGNMIDSPEGTIPETAPVAGYHVNVRCVKAIPYNEADFVDGQYVGDTNSLLPAALIPYAMNPEPSNPKCRFA